MRCSPRGSACPRARSYFVRVESPFGPFFLFTDSTAIRLTGDLRNIFAGDFQHVFIPGFRQDVFVGAVDSNFYDYYRTQNDPFTGAGIINRVNGGIGLFGSIVSIEHRHADDHGRSDPNRSRGASVSRRRQRIRIR